MANQMPLDNIRVLDLSRVISAPWGAMLLADFGAEVIKIEDPRGEDARQMAPFAPNRVSLYYAAHNRNKKCITLNFRHPKFKEVFTELVKKSDVVFENFRPGVMKAMGFGFEEMQKINPGIILLSISGFGQDGPYAFRPGFDQVMQSMYGMCEMTGYPDGEPLKAGTLVIDYLAGTNAAVAVMMALRHRDRTGEGQAIDLALMDGSIAMFSFLMAEYLITGTKRTRNGNQHYYSTPNRMFKTKDGWVFIVIHADNLWARLAKAIGGDELANNPRYAKRPDRFQNRPEVDGIVADWLAKLTTEEAMKILNEAEVPAGPVQDLAQITQDPQVKHRKLLWEVEHPEAGKIYVPATPFKLSKTPSKLRMGPPLLGQHNEEILTSLLSYTKEQVAQLKADGAI